MQNSITEFFDKIYIINLIDRKDRRYEMELQLRKIGIKLPNNKVIFFPAVRPDTSANFPSIGARGCFLSHLGVLNDAVGKGFKRILVCEDDLNFVRDFNRRIDHVINKLACVPWALFYGGYRTAGIGDRSDRPCVTGISPSEPIGTSHFIAFQGTSIASASGYLSAMLDRAPGDPTGGPMHVDGAYTWFRKDNPEFETFIARPELGYQRSSRSDVYKLDWYDRLPFISTIIQYCRVIKSGFKQLFM